MRLRRGLYRRRVAEVAVWSDRAGYSGARRGVERAWPCQQRLHQRWQRMADRGKPRIELSAVHNLCKRDI